MLYSAFYKSMREKYNPDPDNPLTDTSPWPEVEAGGASSFLVPAFSALQ